MATIVPMVSKKSASMRVKTSSTAATTPILLNDPSRLNCPSRPKSGMSTTVEGSAGTLRPQPVGLTTLPVASVWLPMWKTASTHDGEHGGADDAVEDRPPDACAASWR